MMINHLKNLTLTISSAYLVQQAREKYLSLKKSTKADIANVLEEVNSSLPFSQIIMFILDDIAIVFVNFDE